jgi:hypothetical protein
MKTGQTVLYTSENGWFDKKVFIYLKNQYSKPFTIMTFLG